MADSDDTLDSGAFDPLTAPRWPMTDYQESQQSAPFEFVVSDEPVTPTAAPTPPDVDEILRGEYTGWIPLIKAGESFEEAKARAQGAAERALERERIEHELRIAEAERASEKLRQLGELRASQQRLEEERQAVVPSSIDAGYSAPEKTEQEAIPFEPDRLSATDHFAAEQIRIERKRRLDEERIWAEEIRMRGGITGAQKFPSIAESDVPVETPDVQAQTTTHDAGPVHQSRLQEDIVADPESVPSPAQALEEARKRIADLRKNLEHQRLLAGINVTIPVSMPKVATVEPTPAPPVAEGPINDVNDIVVETVVEDREKSSSLANDTYVFKPTTDVYEHSTPAGNEQSASVELMIMRDEVQHLRERLDSSQQLIHDMMIRFANLAELAILNKN